MKRFKNLPPLWHQRQLVLERLPGNQKVEFYQRKLKTSYQVTCTTLRKFKIRTQDLRGSRRKLDWKKVQLAVTRSGKQKSFRELGAELGLSHEGVRLICRKLKLNKPAASAWDKHREARIQLARAAIKEAWKRFWQGSKRALIVELGMVLNHVNSGINYGQLKWPNRRALRQHRLDTRQQLWCGDHQEWLPMAQFSKDRTSSSNVGYQGYCRACHRERVSRGRRLSRAAAAASLPTNGNSDSAAQV